MALPLQGSATYNAPPVFNDSDFHDLQPHEQAQVLGSLYPTFNTLSPQDQAGILTGIQNTYNPQQNPLAGFFNALNATSNQTPQNTSSSPYNTQNTTPVSDNSQNPVGGLQKISSFQALANHPLVNLLNQTAPQTGNNLDQTMKRGTLLANAGQAAQGNTSSNLSGIQNTAPQLTNITHLKTPIQVLRQKYDQLDQVSNNPSLSTITRQNAQNAKLLIQNIFQLLNQQVNTTKQQKPILGTKYFDLQELKRINQRTDQIINESKNEGDKRAVDYFKNSNNRSTGGHSLDKPIPTNNLSIPHYYTHAFLGQGQDLQINIRDLHFDTKTLKASFLGLDNYKTSSNPVSKALEKLQKTGIPQKVIIPQLKFQVEDIQGQGYTIGKVKLRVNGVLLRNAKGRPTFMGFLEQGDNMEVLTFPYGGRHWLKEGPTSLGRKLPLTQFRTIIKGQQPIYIEF